jgi:hypothetical protein
LFLWVNSLTFLPSTKEDTLFDDLPTPFRLDILRYVTRELLEKVPLFKYSFPALRNVLLMALKPQTFAPDGYIAREGEVGKEIYFISRGKVEITTNEGKNSHGTLEGGSGFDSTPEGWCLSLGNQWNGGIYGYLERTSCIGCGSGFQPRSFNFAAGSRSHRGFFMVTWTFRISAK